MPAIVLPQRPSSLAPQIPVNLPQAAKHICLDVETGHADDSTIELSQELARANSNIKDEAKAVADLEKKRKSIREKSALLDGAPISCMSLVTEGQKAVFYHKGYPWPKKIKIVDDIKGFDGEVLCLKDERDMLVAVREWLDKRGVPESIIIGHNLYGFDLPKLRCAFVRNRLILPNVLKPEAKDSGVEVYDTMKRFLGYFTTENSGDRFIKLEVVLARLGIPSHKNRIEGSMIPDMVAKGEVREVITYNALDCLETYAAFRAMAGLYSEETKH